MSTLKVSPDMSISNGYGYNSNNLDISAGRSCAVNKTAVLSISIFLYVIM